MTSPLRVGVGGPVGSGTALLDALCKRLRDRYRIAAITNDIYTREDAEFLTRSGALAPDRILGVETGGCPHTAIREDASINLAAINQMTARFPDLEIVFIESGGDNLAATFSPELACHLTPSHSAAAINKAIDVARAHAEAIHGPLGKPPFLVTDNGPSFLAKRFRAHIGDDFSHVRIRYRTPTQLGLLERFHQTLKSEEVYWQLYDNPGHCRDCLAAFQTRYNEIRPHWALRPAPIP